MVSLIHPRVERAPVGSLGRMAVRLRRSLRAWRERARQRREFAALTERDLRDIGRTRAEIADALAKPFWRA